MENKGVKFIIDCGGWTGNSVKRLRELFDLEGKYLMHTFEPNPAYLPFYKGLKNHVLHAKAVWICDGEIDLYLEKKIPNKEYFIGKYYYLQVLS